MRLVSARSAHERGTRRAPAPRVVAAGGDAQHPAHGGGPIHGLVRPHEPVDPDGIESVSRANQAAAFAKFSRSWRSCRFSRRSRRNLLPLIAREPVFATPLVNIGLMGPGADRLRRGLELVRQRLGRASRPDQLYHLAAELHWIAWVSLWHREHLLYPQIASGVHQTGSNSTGSREIGCLPIPPKRGEHRCPAWIVRFFSN